MYLFLRYKSVTSGRFFLFHSTYDSTSDVCSLESVDAAFRRILYNRTTNSNDAAKRSRLKAF